MALTIWTEHGPGYRSASFFARIAKSLARSDISACYIVPNAGAKRRAETLCLAQGPEIFFGDRILTVSAWFNSLKKTDRPTLTDTQRQQIIRTLLKTVPLDYFRTSATPATCALIARGITSALSAGLSPEQLHHLATDYGQEREQDLAKLFAAYIAQLEKDHWIDAAQIPLQSLNALQNHMQVPYQRIIVDVGMASAPILWKILRALAGNTAPPDLHVIVPEFHRGRAESELAELAQEISLDEWIATPAASTPEAVQLYRAPHPSAEYKWMAHHIKENTGVLTLNTDPTLWMEACMSEGVVPGKLGPSGAGLVLISRDKTRELAPEFLIKGMALPLSLAASPVSAPWFDPATWRRAPTSAPLSDWMTWWRDQLYPNSQIQTLQKTISTDSFVCRALRDITQWESVWLHAAATTPIAQPLTPFELRILMDPLLQTTTHIDADLLPYSAVSLLTHLGEHIPNLIVLDATQSLLPNASGASPFFKSAAMLPQDPNAQLLRDAFPSTESSLQLQIAAWQRLSGCTCKIIAGYAVTSDSLGEQFPSLLLDAVPQDIPAPHASTTESQHRARPETLLAAPDTLAHVRHRMKGHTFSITELEEFAECPFRHFARYILGIKVPDEDSPEIPAKDEGKIIHKLLEYFYSNPHRELNDMFGEEREIAARIILHDILTREIQTTAPLRQIQIERLLQAATSAVLFDLTAHDRLGSAALQPTHLEWTFGEKDVPPLVLHGAGSYPVHIRGKVDRIDINPASRQLLLIDYKYRETKSIIGDIQKGAHLQIPLYLLASQSIFSDFTILGGLLFDLKLVERKHGMAHKSNADFLGIEGRVHSLTKEETWTELLQTASAHAVHYAQQIRDGQTPIENHTCDYCDWKGLLPWEE